MKYDKYVIERDEVSAETNYTYNFFLAGKLQEKGYLTHNQNGSLMLTVFYGNSDSNFQVIKNFKTQEEAIDYLDKADEFINKAVDENRDLYLMSKTVDKLEKRIITLEKTVNKEGEPIKEAD